jgi:hypothetical protein
MSQKFGLEICCESRRFKPSSKASRGRGDRALKRWRTIAVLAVGVTIGVAMVATPAAGHRGGTVGPPKAEGGRSLFPGRNLPAGKTVRGRTGWRTQPLPASIWQRAKSRSGGGSRPRRYRTSFSRGRSLPRSVLGSRPTRRRLRVTYVNGGGAGPRIASARDCSSARPRAGTYWSGGVWAATSGSATVTARPSTARTQAGQ